MGLWSLLADSIVGRMWKMPLSDNGAIDRKLRATTAVFLDPAATEAENAEQPPGCPEAVAQAGAPVGHNALTERLI